MNDNISTSIQLINPQNARIKRRHFVVLILIFLLSISSLCIIYILFPKIDSYVFHLLRSNQIRIFFLVQIKMHLKFLKQSMTRKFSGIFYTNTVNIIDISSWLHFFSLIFCKKMMKKKKKNFLFFVVYKHSPFLVRYF